MDLRDYASAIEPSDVLKNRPDHAQLLVAGLLGETGGIVSELKKKERERDGYPAYRNALIEELGDWLWYFVRFCDVTSQDLLKSLPDHPRNDEADPQRAAFALFRSCSRLASMEEMSDHACLDSLWGAYLAVLGAVHTRLEDITKDNLEKVTSLWWEHANCSHPPASAYLALFDDNDGLLEEDRFPRQIEFEFRELKKSDGAVTGSLRVQGLNIGARLTDNIAEDDHYRLHDVFHIANMVYLGWSPVLRALLNCKRKSLPNVDENQDGARAIVIEEAVTAAVFQQAKKLRFFERVDHVGYDLLKLIRTLVAGYEVERVHLWQWDIAIRRGFEVFRQLRENHGGFVSVHLPKRQMKYRAPNRR